LLINLERKKRLCLGSNKKYSIFVPSKPLIQHPERITRLDLREVRLFDIFLPILPE